MLYCDCYDAAVKNIIKWLTYFALLKNEFKNLFPDKDNCVSPLQSLEKKTLRVV